MIHPALLVGLALTLVAAGAWLLWALLTRRRHQALLRSEARYRLLYTDAADSIFTVSLDGYITAANPATERLGGYSLADWAQHPFLDVILPESMDAVMDVYRRLVAGEVVREFEYGLRKKDGGELYLSASYRPVWENGKVVQVEGIARDVTERRREEQTRRALQEQVQQMQKMQAVGTLAGGIAHDFNNLLTSMLGAVQLAQLELPSDAPVQVYLGQALEAAERAAELTQQLLSLSRRRPLERTATDVNEVVQRTAKLLQRSVPGTIHLELDLDPALRPILADAGQLGQAILNLGINARDAMPEGGEIRIETRAVMRDAASLSVHARTAPGRYLRIRVADTGSGIPAEVQEHVFEPFFTTKPEGHGTGLGLSMVYGCAQEHGGWAELSSQPGRGSCFELYLPQVETPEAVDRDASGGLPRGEETVLLVDDTEGVLRIGRRLLERCGYRVLLASDGEDALRAYEAASSEIALIVSDLVMPRAGGRELLHVLRERGAQVPLILTTGYAIDGRREELLEEGFAAVVVKPFDLQTLAAAVRQVLDAAASAAGGSQAASATLPSGV